MIISAALMLRPAVHASRAATEGGRNDAIRAAAGASVLAAWPIPMPFPVLLPSPLPPLPQAPPLSPAQGDGATPPDSGASALAAPASQDAARQPSAGAAALQPGAASDAPAYLEPPEPTPASGPPGGATPSSAPRPVGLAPEDGQPFFGTWIRGLGLRAALAAGFGGGDSVYNGQPDTTERSSQWSAEVAGSLAVLDQRIFALDYSAAVQHAGAGAVTASADSRNSVRFTDLGLSANLLSGRSTPLRVFASRASAGSDTGISLGDLPESVQDARGTHSTIGVAWELAARGLPKIHVSATKDSDSQVRNFLFGQSQWTTQRRVEARATDSRPTFGYDAAYRFDDFRLDIPDAGLQGQTAQQMLTGAVRFEPTPKWRVDVDGRANRYQLGRNNRNGQTNGLGANASVRFAPADRFFTLVRYSVSTSLSEAILSGQVDPGKAGVEGATSISLGSRVAADDLEGRVGYVRQTGSVELFVHSFSLGLPAYGPPTLSEQRTVGATVRGQRPLAGFQLAGSLEGEFGTAFSTRGVSEPYQAGMGQLSLARQAGRMLRFSLDGYAQRSSRLTFYMVPLVSHSGGARIETLLPAWARLTASVRWSSILRDALYRDFNDRFKAWSVAVAGPRYGLAFDVNNGDAQSLLLSPDLLDRRVDLALVLDRQPGLLGAYMASAVRSQQLSAFVEPVSRLQVRAFLQRESRQNFGLYDLDTEGAQVSVVYQLRQVQLEAGWNRYLTSSTLDSGSYKNQRYFARIRRDFSF